MEMSSNESNTSEGKTPPDSLTVAPPPAPPAPPPNGGLTAWLQVLGAAFLFFNSWGIVNTFGVYQAYYEANDLSTISPSTISWIGTIQGFLLITVGVITGPLYDLGHLRALICAGTLLTVLGLLTTSVATQYYQIFLALGVCVGVGGGCLFVPSVAIVATYFSSRRAIAMGLTAAGGSVGGVVFPLVFRALTVRVGVAWATRTIAFIAFATLAVSLAVLRPRVQPAARRTLLEPAAFREPPYLFFSIALFFIFIGLYIPFFYLPSYALATTSASPDLAFGLLAILNAGSVFGRIGPNLLADRVGSLPVLLPCTLVTAGLAFAWVGIHSLAGLVVFAVLYGFFSGAIVSLPPTALAALSPDLSRVGTRMGMCFSFAGFGLLLGSPIAGAILKATGGFAGAEVFGAAATLAGFGFLVLALLAHRKEGPKKGTTP